MESKEVNGYEQLVINYTDALQLNSNIIIQALNELTKKDLSAKDKRTLKKLGRTLKKIDNNLEAL